jgi:hypothetical protein
VAKRTAKQRQEFKDMLLKRDGRCLVCSAYLDELTINPHHLTTKGAGGDDQPENGISLCQACHVAVHNGQYSPASLRLILSIEYGYQYPAWQLGDQQDRAMVSDLLRARRRLQGINSYFA